MPAPKCNRESTYQVATVSATGHYSIDFLTFLLGLKMKIIGINAPDRCRCWGWYLDPRQPREQMFADRQGMTFGPDEAVHNDGFASLGQAAELALRVGER